MKFKNVVKILPAIFLVFLTVSPNLAAEGHFELSFHYGTWNLDLLGNLVEDGLSEALETAFEEVILNLLTNKEESKLQY